MLFFSFCADCLDTETDRQTVCSLTTVSVLPCTCKLTSYGCLFRTWYSGLDVSQPHSFASENQRRADSFQFTATHRKLHLLCSVLSWPLECSACPSVCPYAEITFERLIIIFTKFWYRTLSTYLQLNVAFFLNRTRITNASEWRRAAVHTGILMSCVYFVWDI
jgi:hypothetical protein